MRRPGFIRCDNGPTFVVAAIRDGAASWARGPPTSSHPAPTALAAVWTCEAQPHTSYHLLPAVSHQLPSATVLTPGGCLTISAPSSRVDQRTGSVQGGLRCDREGSERLARRG